MPVPDGRREKRETGAAAGIARCLRPAASPERRRRRAQGPEQGWAGAGQPLPGRREVERAGGRRHVRPCTGPPARPSSRRRGRAGPMSKGAPGQWRPAPPPARYFLLGVGRRGAVPAPPDPAARARRSWQLQPGSPSALRSPRRALFLAGGCPVSPSHRHGLPSLLTPPPPEGEARGSGFQVPDHSSGQQAGRRRVQTCPRALCDFGRNANLSGLNTASSQRLLTAPPVLGVWASWDGRLLVFLSLH